METQGNTPGDQPQIGTPDVTAAVVNSDAATPMVIPAELQEKISTKYGGDVNKAIESLMHAEQRMHEATTRQRELERELESVRISNQNPNASYPTPPHPGNGGSATEEERRRMEADFGLPYEQAMGIFKINQITQLPMLEAISETKLESVKATMRRDDQNFTPQVEQRFDAMIKRHHPQDRMIPQIINQCLREAKGDSVDDIINARMETFKKQFQGKPLDPAPINRPVGTPSVLTKSTISDEEAVNIASWKGVPVEEVKAMYRE